MRARALAKVTLSLRVLGRRADGYHDLEALTVSATEPYDDLELTDATTIELSVDGPFAAGAPRDATNLVARALDALGRTMHVTLHKGIPAGAGLGGGSSDAAAVLRVLGGGADDAARLGADVPFCMQQQPAWMRGRGEVLDSITGLPPIDLVIVAPDFSCSTPTVYRAWDELGGPRSTRTVDAPDAYPGPFVNDLEPAAEHLEPRLREFREQVVALIRRDVLLCGSGSAYAAWFDRASDADGAAAALRRMLGTKRVWAARTVDS